MTRVAFDLDGTLYRTLPGRSIDYASPDSIREDTVAFLEAMRGVEAVADFDLHVVTGRTHAVREATLDKLRHDFAFIPEENVVFQDQWMGWDALHRFKADALASIGKGSPSFYVGDLDVDRLAAKAAGWSYLDAELWRSCYDAPEVVACH